MKKETHPENYRPVIFADNSSSAQFLIGSIVKTEEKGKWKDGKEYDLIHVEITSASHPFYTGQEKVLDTAGRVEKFRARQSAAKSKK
jgi:large subunit ribosomal protein L31